MKGKMIIKYLMLLLCVFSVVFLQGCTFFFDFYGYYEEEAKERIDELAAAIEVGDEETIYELLSPYAKEEIEEPKEKIGEFLDFFEGEIVSAKQNSNGCHVRQWSEEKEWGGTCNNCIDVKTKKKTYLVNVLDCHNNSDEEKVGIFVIKVIEDDKTDSIDGWKVGSEDFPQPCITCYE